jgi:hypothetical protein
MVASNFEFRHQRLIHNLIVGAAFLTYLFQPDDIVWRFVKGRPAPHTLERYFFLIATLLVIVGAGICTWARATDRARLQYAGDFIYAIGLGSLFPVAGFVILLCGEAVRLARLALHGDAPPSHTGSRWGMSIRQEAVKWCLVITMIVFVITLRDRVADILVAASFVVGLICNGPWFGRR